MKLKVRKRFVLLISLMSYLLAGLDNSLVLTSLTNIQADLHLNQVSLSWIQDAYGLAFGSFILISGKVGDIFGRRKMMIVALSLFAASSWLTAISNIAELTIISRFIQGIGAAILAPTSLALLIDYFTGPSLDKAIAWYSSIAGLGMSIGLILGGTLADYLTWRVGFHLNAIIALILLIMSIIVLEKKSTPIKNVKLDYLGAILSILGSGFLVYAVNGAKQVLLFLILAIVLLTLFVLNEQRADQAIMPLSLLKNRTRILAYLSRGLLVAASMGFYFFVSEYMQDHLHFSPLLTGIAYLPMTGVLFVTAIAVSRLIEKVGNETNLLMGSIALLIAFIWTLIFKNGNYVVTLLVPEILFGVGQGLALAPQTNLGIYGVDQANSGAASSTLNMFHQIGGVLGIAIMVQAGVSIVPVKSIVGRFDEAMVVGLIIGILLVITAFLENKSKK